ncbi:hypothetical protein D0U02_32610 [Burkholderia pseudomallei]|nr:hypothetical protein BOC51_01560 [Burkholderia pseudomallei]AYX36606.1 hypothetical protein EGY15_17100 [Burkholderia pseudomallei]RFS50376.1 hypothetical protein D0U05_27105 [Burkholderia pseudomallei]RFS53117.1 hypothetical protein D0U02_32610 [Burkholderia pseudomallei]RFS57564.1 hypothetical protein D0U01_28815 [Burkholderia pseudomallei]
MPAPVSVFRYVASVSRRRRRTTAPYDETRRNTAKRDDSGNGIRHVNLPPAERGAVRTWHDHRRRCAGGRREAAAAVMASPPNS